MTLAAKSGPFEPNPSRYLVALYATIDTDRESFDFYVPPYPMGVLKQVGDELYLFHKTTNATSTREWFNDVNSRFNGFQWECRVLLLKVFGRAYLSLQRTLVISLYHVEYCVFV